MSRGGRAVASRIAQLPLRRKNRLAGVLGAVLAWQHKGDLVWQVIEGARPTICIFGGMTEVMENDEWNMQYFGTAQGAVCIAIHQMLLQVHDDQIELFPALPSSWEGASFEHLLAAGFSVVMLATSPAPSAG